MYVPTLQCFVTDVAMAVVIQQKSPHFDLTKANTALSLQALLLRSQAPPAAPQTKFLSRNRDRSLLGPGFSTATARWRHRYSPAGQWDAPNQFLLGFRGPSGLRQRRELLRLQRLPAAIWLVSPG